jgi:uncharacterized cupredoxin-like copper-binding protein
MWRIAVALSVGALLVGTACSGPASTVPAPAAGQFTMHVDNTMQFGTPTLAVQVGEPVELTLENDGGMLHDFSLSDGVAEPIKVEAAGGQRAESTFVVQQPGTYQFVCSQPGHALAGMHGTIVAH